MKYDSICFVKVLSDASLLSSRLFLRHHLLVVINACCLIFIIVFSSSPINKFHRPSCLALLYSIGGLLNDMNVLKVLYFFIIW